MSAHITLARHRRGPLGRFSFVVFAAAVFSLFIPAAFAQQDSARIELNGKVELVSPVSLGIKDKKLGDWLLEVRPATKIEMRGKADLSYLEKGSNVKFSAEFDDQEACTKPVEKVQLVGELNKNEVGLFGEHDDSPVRKAEAGTYRVQGSVKSVSETELVVAAGNRTLTFPLAEKCEVLVSTDDVTLVQKGDDVHAWAIYSQENRPNSAQNIPGRGVAVALDLTLSKALTPQETKKVVRKGNSNSRGKKRRPEAQQLDLELLTRPKR